MAILLAASLAAPAQETIDTRIGKLSFTHRFEDGYPTDPTRQLLFDEMDFQRATQAYIWSIPMVSMARWRLSHEEELGAANGQIVFLESYADKIGGLTYNATTPYVLPFIDLADGPWVLEMPGPDGAVRGAAHDMCQIGMSRAIWRASSCSSRVMDRKSIFGQQRDFEGQAWQIARDIAKTRQYDISMKLRKNVEMLFAHLKRILGLGRLRLRGPCGANDEFLLAATAQNLRKLAKIFPAPQQTRKA